MSQQKPVLVRSLRACFFHDLMLFYSLLFPDPKPILEGAVAVTSAKYGNSYEFLDIATVNAVQFHRPSEAMYVVPLWVYDALTRNIGAYLYVLLTLTPPLSSHLWGELSTSHLLTPRPSFFIPILVTCPWLTKKIGLCVPS